MSSTLAGRPKSAWVPVIRSVGVRRRALLGYAAAIFSAATLSAVRPRRADAHAIVVGSLPAAGAEVNQTQLDIRITFNSRIDRRRSRLVLYGPDRLEKSLPIIDDAAPNIVSSAAAGLVGGEYRLRWQVLAVDGHITRGDIPFIVKPTGA